MRHLQDTNKLDFEHVHASTRGGTFEEVEDFVFQVLAPHLLPYLGSISDGQALTFEKLPFFMDERMFVIGFCAFPEETDITLHHRYRAGRLDGIDLQGNAEISASHHALHGTILPTVRIRPLGSRTRITLPTKPVSCA